MPTTNNTAPASTPVDWTDLFCEGSRLFSFSHHAHQPPKTTSPLTPAPIEDIISFLQKLDILPPNYIPPPTKENPAFAPPLQPDLLALWPHFLPQPPSPYPYSTNRLMSAAHPHPLCLFFCLLWHTALNAVAAQLTALQLTLQSTEINNAAALENLVHTPPSNHTLQLHQHLPPHWIPQPPPSLNITMLQPPHPPIPPSTQTSLWSLSQTLNPNNPTCEQLYFHITFNTDYLDFSRIAYLSPQQPLLCTSLRTHTHYPWHTSKTSLTFLPKTTAQLCNSANSLAPLAPYEVPNGHILPLAPLMTTKPSLTIPEIYALRTAQNANNTPPDWNIIVQILQHIAHTLCPPSDTPFLQVSTLPKGNCALHSPLNPHAPICTPRQMSSNGTLNWRKTLSHMFMKSIAPLYCQLHSLQETLHLLTTFLPNIPSPTITLPTQLLPPPSLPPAVHSSLSTGWNLTLSPTLHVHYSNLNTLLISSPYFPNPYTITLPSPLQPIPPSHPPTSPAHITAIVEHVLFATHLAELSELQC